MLHYKKSLFYTINKNKLRMNLRPKYINANIKTVEENIKEFIYIPGVGKAILRHKILKP